MNKAPPIISSEFERRDPCLYFIWSSANLSELMKNFV
jgi:hypothetical protein